MGRKPRHLAQDLYYHIRSQCNNKAYRFENECDFHRYLDLLDIAKRQLNFRINAYNLMNTHVHIIGYTPGPALLDQIMHKINKDYSTSYNTHHGRAGHFWMGPYKCDVLDSDAYALTCMRYVDRNPLRAGMVGNPSEWPWSSYRFYAYGESNPLIDPIPSYLGLASTEEQRQAIYREFVLSILPSDEEHDKTLINMGLKGQRKATVPGTNVPGTPTIPTKY